MGSSRRLRARKPVPPVGLGLTLANSGNRAELDRLGVVLDDPGSALDMQILTTNASARINVS